MPFNRDLNGGTINWRYKCYKNARGKNEIIVWLRKRSKKGQLHARRTLEHLGSLGLQYWKKPHGAKIRGYNHIYVIHFHDENKQEFRLFGFHSQEAPEPNVFVIVLTGTEKDDEYTPANYADITKKRMAECLTNWSGRTCNCLATNADNWLEPECV